MVKRRVAPKPWKRMKERVRELTRRVVGEASRSVQGTAGNI